MNTTPDTDRDLVEIILYAAGAYRRGIPVERIFTVTPTDANGYLGAYIHKAIEYHAPRLMSPAVKQGVDELLDIVFQLDIWCRSADTPLPPALRERMRTVLSDDGPFRPRIFLREDHAQQTTDPRDCLLHAAYIMEGLRDLDYSAVLDKWDQGSIELTSQLMRYVPVIDAAMRAADQVGAEYAGVFDYEVSADFGTWCGERVLQTGQLPPYNECAGYISGSAQRFFRQGSADVQQLAAIRAAVEPFIEPEPEGEHHG